MQFYCDKVSLAVKTAFWHLEILGYLVVLEQILYNISTCL